MTDPVDKRVPAAVDETAPGADATRLRRQKRRLHAWLLRWTWRLVTLALVLVASYVTAGRLLMPLVTGQIAGIESRLSGALGLEVTIAGLEGSWFHFSPGLEVSGLRLLGASELTESLVVERAFLTLDVLTSLMQRQLVIDRINMAGLRLVLQEGSDGRWSLAGMTGGGPDYTDRILDVLLDTRNLALTESVLELRRNDGSILDFSSLFLDLRNRLARHEFQMQFRFNGQASPTQVQLDLEGDPRGRFGASVYINTAGLELAPLLPSLPETAWEFARLGTGGRFWLELDDTGLQQVRGSLSGFSAQLLERSGSGEFMVENGTLAVHAMPVKDGAGSVSAWTANFTGIGFDLQQTPWDVGALQIRIPMAGSETLSVAAASLEVPMLRQILANNGVLPGNAADIIATLNPRGLLHNLHLQTAADGSYPDRFLLRANFDRLAVDAWGGAPAGSGLQGYLEASGSSGFAEVASDDAELHLPQLFAQPWHYDLLNTRVDWQFGEGALWVGSNAINVENSGLRGSVQFGLRNTHDSNGSLRSDLSLKVGMEHMDVAMRSLYLPTIPRLRETMDWLDAALQGGTIRDSGFLLRTSTLANAPPGSSSFATWYHVEEGVLKFLPDWPAVEGIAGEVHVQDGEVAVKTASASIAGLQLEPVQADLSPLPGGGNLLIVEGAGSGTTETGLDFLRSTPVRDATGPFLDNWEAEGAVRAELRLELPIGAANQPRRIAVDVTSTDSTLRIPDQSLDISAINGLVRYDNMAGLSSAGLQASLFDAPMLAEIETLAAAEPGQRLTRISGSGTVAVSALQQWEGAGSFVSKLLAHADGELAYKATLDILGQDAPGGVRSRLVLESDLLGMVSHLPRPLARSADESGALQLDLAFRDAELELGLRYGDLLTGQLILDDEGVDRGQLYVGELNRDFTARQSDDDMPGLLVNGQLPAFDYDAWREVAASIAGDESEGQGLEDYLRFVDVDFGTLSVAGQELQDINVQVEFLQEGLQIRGSNRLLAGSITMPPGSAAPWQVDLDYLRFPPRPEPPAEELAEEEEELDLLADVDPRALPAFDFTTPEISIGEDNLGAFSFSLRPSSTGATIADFRMQSTDAGISDIPGSGGANIDWRYRDGNHNSSFNGRLDVGNLARVLPMWGHDAFVDSQRGRLSGTLQWPGSPLAFALKESSGQVLMDINNGRFVNIESGSSRLVGALNFDSLARRLQLDFSDLFQRGFAFDRISGNLNFDEGVVTPNGGILIDGPSSRITINGEVDLAARTIAADMLVRIPLGQNISMLAGLLGAWPIALSTYLASKIFQDQVEDFATVIYRLEGPWDNPRAGFEPPPEAATGTTQ